MKNAIELEIMSVEGDCSYNYAPGMKFRYFEDEIFDTFCLLAFHALTPALTALNHGARFEFREDPETMLTTCPGKGRVMVQSRVVDGRSEDISDEKI
jgi:uncharacterized repeat protein (TIGR04076 family)